MYVDVNKLHTDQGRHFDKLRTGLAISVLGEIDSSEN